MLECLLLTGVDPVYVAGFSSRQKAGQHLDVVSTGRYLLLPYPCAQVYKDGEVTSATEHRTCASKATPDAAQAAPSRYLSIGGTSFSAPTLSGIVALMLEKNPSLNNADAAFGAPNRPSSWGRRPGAAARAVRDADPSRHGHDHAPQRDAADRNLGGGRDRQRAGCS